MKRTKRITLSIAAATAVTTAILGAAVLPGAQAAQQSSPAAAAPVNNSGIPAFVNPGADLAASGQPNDSIYVSNWVKGGGHDFGILVHVWKPVGSQPVLRVSVTDDTTGWYKSYVKAIPSDKLTWSTKKLYIAMPGLTWTGDAQQMSVHATTPWGAINLHLTDKGPALKYGGSGIIQVYGSTNYEYALPYLTSTGTLTVRGQTNEITGRAWLDRQWGPIPFSPSSRWTWMNISLSNGDKVAVWDALNSTVENSWATVLHPDGSYELAAVTPLAAGAGDPWTSPASGNTYPTRWSIDIPSLHSHLQVKITGTDDQELTTSQGSGMEATGAVTGHYEGEKVTGRTYIELAGLWKA